MTKNNIFSILILSFILFSCSEKLNHKLSSNLGPPSDKYLGHYKIGNPYIVENVKYYPKKDENYRQIGIASWYGGEDGFHGKRTANGDFYNKRLFTAAHKTLPLLSLVKIKNLKNNRFIIAMINDRGPFTKNRIIDVSELGAEMLHMKHQGHTQVEVEFLKSETKDLLRYLAINEVEGSKSKSKLGSKSLENYLKSHNQHHYDNIKTVKNSSKSKIQKANSFQASSKKYFVKVGAYKSKNNAEKIARELKKFGKYKIKFVKELKLHEVSFGPFIKSEGNSLIEYLSDIGNDNVQLIAYNK